MRRRFNNLPKEIMLEILTRLPTESVLECKMVCKPWRDLVHLPSFSQMHLNHLNSSDDDSGKLSFVFLNHVFSNLFCFSSDDDSITGEEYSMRHEFSYAEYDENSQETPFGRKARLNINLPFDKCGYEFVGSCNGLICIDSWFSKIYEPTYIFNPITREYIILPTSKVDYWWTGFGYILSTNEYKVVRVYNNTRGDSNVTSVYVYTLGSSIGWRNVGTVDMDMQICRRTEGAFANGALHWEDNAGSIFAFHLTDEKFSKLPSLPCLTEADSSNYPIFAGVLGDFLSATYSSTAFVSEIWFLKKNKDNYNDLSCKEFSFHTYMSPPFGYTKSGRFLCHDHHKIYSYDIKESSERMDVNFGESIDGAIAHKNTLVSLKALGEKDAKTMESGERAS